MLAGFLIIMTFLVIYIDFYLPLCYPPACLPPLPVCPHFPVRLMPLLPEKVIHTLSVPDSSVLVAPPSSGVALIRGTPSRSVRDSIPTRPPRTNELPATYEAHAQTASAPHTGSR